MSLAPLAKLQAYKQRMGWTFPWASSLRSDFNFDWNVSFTEEQQREGDVEYNYRRGGFVMDLTPVPKPVAEFAAMSGTDPATYTRERPGMSAFMLEDGVVYHAYSTYARGLDGLWGMYRGSTSCPRGVTSRASGGAATMNTSRFLKTPARVATRQKRTRETLATSARTRRGTAMTFVGPRRAQAAVCCRDLVRSDHSQISATMTVRFDSLPNPS